MLWSSGGGAEAGAERLIRSQVVVFSGGLKQERSATLGTKVAADSASRAPLSGLYIEEQQEVEK